MRSRRRSATIGLYLWRLVKPLANRSSPTSTQGAGLVDRIKRRRTPLRRANHFVVDARIVGRILPRIFVEDGRVDVRVQYCQLLFAKIKHMWSAHDAPS